VRILQLLEVAGQPVAPRTASETAALVDARDCENALDVDFEDYH
jgi:hypothetical protein